VTPAGRFDLTYRLNRGQAGGADTDRPLLPSTYTVAARYCHLQTEPNAQVSGVLGAVRIPPSAPMIKSLTAMTRELPTSTLRLIPPLTARGPQPGFLLGHPWVTD
jgi:hypothetical protein